MHVKRTPQHGINHVHFYYMFLPKSNWLMQQNRHLSDIKNSLSSSFYVHWSASLTRKICLRLLPSSDIISGLPIFFRLEKKLPSCGVSLCFGFTSLACRSPGGGVKVQGDPADSYHTVALFDPPWNYPKLQPCSWVGYHVGNVGIITNEIGRSLLRYILCRVGIDLPVHDVFWGWKKSRQVLDKGIVLQDLYTW